WTDNDNFTLWVGKGKRKWRCEVNFEGEEISAELYLDKEEKVAEAAADVETEAEVDVEEAEEN
ncbi:MAG: hypothetical protein IIX75_02715, partial [Clostridia bacterium]|nr:hypothetical protein [Clostridia bacterium]